MLIIPGLFLTFTLGLAIVLFFAPSLARWEKAVLAWVIGLGLVTQELFLLSLLGIDYSVWTVVSPLLVVNFVLWFLLRQKISFKIRLHLSPHFLISKACFWFRELSLIEQILIILLTILVFGAFVKAIFWPVYYWDALAWYDYRAKLFFDAKSIFKATTLASIPIHGFPPMTSLAHTFIYILGDRQANPQFLYPLFYLTLILTFYISVRKECQRWASLLFTFYLASIPLFFEFAANAYTNVPYAFYFGMGTVYLYRFMREQNKGLLIIAGILLGLAGWTRSPTEQFFLANLVVCAFWSFARKKDYDAPLILLFLFIIFNLPWKFYTYFILKLPLVAPEMASAIGAGLTSSLDPVRFLTVVKTLFESIKGVSGVSLAMAFLVTLLYPRTAKKNIFLLLILFLNFFAFVIGTYFFSLSWHDWRDAVLNSAHRLSMFLPPFALYYTAISVKEFL